MATLEDIEGNALKWDWLKEKLGHEAMLDSIIDNMGTWQMQALIRELVADWDLNEEFGKAFPDSEED